MIGLGIEMESGRQGKETSRTPPLSAVDNSGFQQASSANIPLPAGKALSNGALFVCEVCGVKQAPGGQNKLQCGAIPRLNKSTTNQHTLIILVYIESIGVNSKLKSFQSKLS